MFTGLPPRWRLHELFLMKKRIFPDAAHNSYVEKECVCVYSPSSRGARCLLPTGDCDAIGGLIGPRCVGGSPIGVLTRHRPFDWNRTATRVYGDTVDSDKISERISHCSTLCRESAISPSGDSVETTTSNIIVPI